MNTDDRTFRAVRRAERAMARLSEYGETYGRAAHLLWCFARDAADGDDPDAVLCCELMVREVNRGLRTPDGSDERAWLAGLGTVVRRIEGTRTTSAPRSRPAR